MNRALSSYIDEVKSEVAALVYSEGEGASFEDKFTEYCLETLESIDKTEGARVLSFVHPNSKGGIDWKINGYCLKDAYKDDSNKSYFETLELFVTHYVQEDYSYNILKSDFEKVVNQIKRFINGAFKRHIDYIDSSNEELTELLKIIAKQSQLFDRVNINLLMNGSSNQKNEKIIIKGLEELSINLHVWDINRFFRVNETNSNREPIEIDFSDYLKNTQNGIQCLKVPSINELYDCYLAIIPGSLLASLYKEFSNELLESNVRAFLGQAGKFNKGIRDTIREKPQMFLPYNNGITATANEVETKSIDNNLFITKLNDFQIVNGGQTTASLYHTQKKYKDEVDLNSISVQMKLTVIKDIDQKNIEVPNIARYANSQNKVSELDLSSNNPYFVKIESLSRKKYVINPENTNQSVLWFFERVKGQYKESSNKLTTSMQKKFKEQNPTKFKFVKSDVAKYINLWDLKPFMVARGSQKNFIYFTKNINELVEKNKLPGENFYKKLIANAIIFRAVDKLFGRKNVNAIGDTNLKSYSVAYTIGYYHFLTENKTDLWKIYTEQKLDDSLTNLFKKLLVFVYSHLIKNAANTLISEYAKKENSWKKLLTENHKIELSQIKHYIISEAEFEKRKGEKDLENKNEDKIFAVSEIKKYGVKFWDGIKIYLGTKKIDFDYYELSDLVRSIKNNKNLSARNIFVGKKVLKYILSNKISVDEIKSLSKLKEKEIIEIKFAYDRLSNLKSQDWKRIIALGEQTKLFEYKELSNIKYVSSKVLRKDPVKEESLIKCYNSLNKVKKFGIKI
tara:strand:+ start:6057 stop:8438 length:2382 start_codon:yes stop_codon:yes gene_type:complete